MRLGIPAILALTLCAAPAHAQSEAFCAASQKLLDRVHEMLTEWQEPEEVGRRGMMRILTRASLARAYAGDEGMPEELVAALDVLKIARDNDDPLRVPDEDVPAAIYYNIMIVAAYMPELCPEVTVPDYTPFSHFSPNAE